jgi:hypothetical protein
MTLLDFAIIALPLSKNFLFVDVDDQSVSMTVAWPMPPPISAVR